MWYEEKVSNFKIVEAKLKKTLRIFNFATLCPERSVGTSVCGPKDLKFRSKYDSLYANFTPTLAYLWYLVSKITGMSSLHKHTSVFQKWGFGSWKKRRKLIQNCKREYPEKLEINWNDKMTMMIFGELQAKILVLHCMYMGRKGETKKTEIAGWSGELTYLEAHETLAGVWAGGTEYGVIFLLNKIVCFVLCVTLFPFVIFPLT